MVRRRLPMVLVVLLVSLIIVVGPFLAQQTTLFSIAASTPTLIATAGMEATDVGGGVGNTLDVTPGGGFSSPPKLPTPYVDFSTATPFPSPTPIVSQALPVATITTLEDTEDFRCDPQDCSLRDAVFNVADGGRIEFKAGLSGTFRPQRVRQTRVHPSIYITKSLIEIVGPGPKADQIILDASSEMSLFVVTSASGSGIPSVTFKNLAFYYAQQASIIVDVGTVKIVDCAFRSNPDLLQNRESQGRIDRSGIWLARYGDVSIVSSIFEENTTTGFREVITNRGGQLKILNSTFLIAELGIQNRDGFVSIVSSTFSATGTDDYLFFDNSFYPAERVAVHNTILSGHIGRLNYGCGGAFIDGGHNLQFQTKGCGTVPSGDPKLEPLADNGGPTKTMRLMSGSAALGAGDPKLCSEANDAIKDQRGFPRIDKARQDETCNIGAFEE